MKSEFNSLLIASIICLSILYLPIILTGKPSNTQIAPYQNNNLSATYNTTEITLYRNETKVVRAEVKLGGDFVNETYFRISDLHYDLGESVIDYDNGSYDIYFQPAANEDIKSGNYSTQIVAIRGDTNTSTSFTLNLLSYDHLAPNLTVISPKSNKTYSNQMYLDLRGSDNMGWKELQVEYRGQRIYSLLQIEDEGGRGEWNKTHLKVQTYIFFDELEGNNEIRITLIDYALNSTTVVRNSVGDAISPEVSWVQPSNNDVIVSRDLNIEWKASDNVALDKFEVFVNNVLLGEYTAEKRSAEIFLSIPEDQKNELVLKIVAFDKNDNVETVSISITYDPTLTQDQDSFNTNNIWNVIAFILLAIIGIGIIWIAQSAIRDYREGKETTNPNNLTKFPKNDIITVFEQVEPEPDVLDEIKNKISIFQSHINSETSFDMITNELETLETQLVDILSDFDNSEKYVELIDSVFKSWKKENTQQ